MFCKDVPWSDLPVDSSAVLGGDSRQVNNKVSNLPEEVILVGIQLTPFV